MSRYILIGLAMLLASFTVVPAAPTHAQGPASQQPAIPPSPVTIAATGSYAQVAGSAVVEAFDRAMQELDGWPEQASPTDVKNATFRRRLLELRLLMDYAAFLYDPNLLGTFRGLVDDAYERVGAFQDLDVVQTILKAPVSPDIVNVRQIRMNVALGALRSPNVRSIMRGFLASTSSSARTLAPKDTPLLWTTAQQTPSDQLDGVGNAALFGASALNGIQASGPFVADVFDPVQEAHFHDVRKSTRSVLLLMNMFPDTRRVLPGTAEPLFALVSQYGDVNDAFTAYRMASTLGLGQDAPAAFLRDEFSKAQARQQVVVDSHSYDALIGKLSDVQHQHQR
jgi:hypothetical protein